MLTLLRTPDVLTAFGMKRPTLYEHMAKGLFPRPVKLGSRFAAWPKHECDAVLSARIAGKTDDEIRSLVVELTDARRSFAASA